MLQIIQSEQNKPNRLETKESGKDKQYHTDYARWVLGDGYTEKQQRYLLNYEINYNFYKNNQWILQEDTEAFFKDESGHDTHRIKVTRNYIQPMVEQYRGSAKRMSFRGKVHAFSPMAKGRRERELNRLLSYRDVADTLPEFGEYLKNRGVPIGRNEDEARQSFESTYSDKYVIAMNRLLRHVEELNNLDSFKTRLAQDLALAGINIMYPYPYNGQWLFRHIEPDSFGWDRAATNPDLSDAEYFYEFEYMNPTYIYEQFPDLSQDERKRIEDTVSKVDKQTDKYKLGHRMPVYTVVWRDTKTAEFGYVTDQFGQRYLAMLDPVDDEEVEYKKEDTIPVNKLTEYQKNVLRGKRTRVLYVDLWRYAKFTPNEFLASVLGQTKKRDDICYEYGVLPYQEPDLYDPTNMKPPYKVGTWSYLKGEVMSPVDVVRNPQRMINRFLSIMESHINHAGGSGPVYDTSLLEEKGQEEEIIQKMKRGEPVGIFGRGKGVQNAIGGYDSSITKSTTVFANLIDNYRVGMEQVTGVNEGLKGQQADSDQLVGVMQLMIQRGSILQEPFYDGLESVYRGCYESIASAAKRYYIDLDVELMDAVGMESAEVLKLSKDVKYENFRCSIERSIDVHSERMYVDKEIYTWLQFGLIDQDTASKLIGRANWEEALGAMRAFAQRLAEAKKKQEAATADMTQQQQEQNEQLNQAVYAENLRQEAREDLEKQKDRSTEVLKTAMQRSE